MTRVDVSNVAIVTRSDGSPCFMAETMTYKVDGGAVWISLRDGNGEIFAVGKVPADRALNFVAQAAVDLGGELKVVS